MTEIKKERVEKTSRSQNSMNINNQQASTRSALPNNMNGHASLLRTRGYRHNHEQKLYLVDFMEAHPEFAFGRYSGPRQKSQALWLQLTQEMNARGPKKTVAQWQKAWTDVKSRAKSRVASKANNRGFDPENDLDARVLTLLESINEYSASKKSGTDYVSCGLADQDADLPTNQANFFNSLQASILPPEMVLLPENEEPEPLESCSIADVKDVLETTEHLNMGDLPLDDENSSFDTRDSVQNFDQNGSYDEAGDTGQNYVESSSYSTKDTRQNYYQRHGYNSLRNRLRKLPNRNSNLRTHISNPVSSIQRRQTETFEVISKVMQQNAENEKERNQLLTQSLEISKARLEAEKERNNLLRELVSTLKELSQDKKESLT